jgi:hypothetical protein
METIYGSIRVSTDEYLEILTKQELNRESSKMRRVIIIVVIQENQSRTIQTHTDQYGFVLNGRSRCTE